MSLFCELDHYMISLYTSCKGADAPGPRPVHLTQVTGTPQETPPSVT